MTYCLAGIPGEGGGERPTGVPSGQPQGHGPPLEDWRQVKALRENHGQCQGHVYTARKSVTVQHEARIFLCCMAIYTLQYTIYW